MKSFDINRFGLSLKWFIMSNWKSLLRMFIGVFLAFFVIEMMFLNKFLSVGLMGTVSFIVFVMVVYFVIGASRMFSGLRSKQQRIGFLMHPASNQEKFLIRYIYYTFIWMSIVLLAFCAADTLRVLVNFIISGGCTASGIPCLADINFIKIDVDGTNMLTPTRQMMTIIGIHAYYMFGGALFRRHSFLWCSAIYISFTFLFSFVVMTSFNSAEDMYRAFFTDTLDIIYNINDIFFIVFYYVGSFWLFKRMQVVNNRWINI